MTCTRGIKKKTVLERLQLKPSGEKKLYKNRYIITAYFNYIIPLILEALISLHILLSL